MVFLIVLTAETKKIVSVKMTSFSVDVNVVGNVQTALSVFPKKIFAMEIKIVKIIAMKQWGNVLLIAVKQRQLGTLQSAMEFATAAIIKTSIIVRNAPPISQTNVNAIKLETLHAAIIRLSTLVILKNVSKMIFCHDFVLFKFIKSQQKL